jgi:hypothetical protein
MAARPRFDARWACPLLTGPQLVRKDEIMRTLAVVAAMTLGLAAPAGCSGDDDGATEAAAGAGGAGAGGGAGSTTASSSSGSGQFDCDVCQLAELACEVPGGPLGTTTITAQTATGCSGTISAGDEVAPIWIHCDTATICVEHENECFAATATPTSFSYEIPDKYVITCTGQ